MKLSTLFPRNKPVISFEFFPPKTDDSFTLLTETLKSLKELSPTFVSMTYGAGGSTRGKTVEWVARIKHDIGIEPVAHLTCVGHTKDEIDAVLNELHERGIENILALRGDPPKGHAVFVPTENGFRYASELVAHIRQRGGFSIGVAGYPEKHIEAPSLESDLQHLKEKVDAGGQLIVTQLFFDNRHFFSFVKKIRERGITVPVIAGIMPVTDLEQTKRFSSLCGATLPPDFLMRLEAVGMNKERVVEEGVRFAVAQCEELLKGGAAGLHFYTLNKSRATRDIFLQLRQKGMV